MPEPSSWGGEPDGPPWPGKISKTRAQAGSVKCTGSRESRESKEEPQTRRRAGPAWVALDDPRSVPSLLAPLNPWAGVRI